MIWETMDEFRRYICDTCESNDWYCPADCDFLEKAKKYPIDKINKAFEDCGEDIFKLCRIVRENELVTK